MSEQKIEKDVKVESLSWSDLLTTIYDVNRAIFRHLPIRSIYSCASVCQSWSHLAHLIKEHRHTIHTLTYPSHVLSRSAPMSYLQSDFDAFISSYMHDHLWSIPHLAFVVLTKNLEKKGFQSLPSSPPPTKYPKRSRSQTTTDRTKRCDISQALIHHLNKSCQVLTIVSDGIVASNDENQSVEVETEDAMGILFLPKFPSNVVGIYPFEILRGGQISDIKSRSDLYRLLGCVSDDVPIRCIIIFLTLYHPHSVLQQLIRKISEYSPSEVAIIGGYVSRSRYNDRQTERRTAPGSICGIVLTGDSNHLDIRQVVLNNDIDSREKIRDKLKQLQSVEYPPCYSFAVQASCVARGSLFYNHESNVECSEFKKLFPHTPLIGIFGNGEIGHDYLPNGDQTLSEHNVFHTYSTVFSLISLRL